MRFSTECDVVLPCQKVIFINIVSYQQPIAVFSFPLICNCTFVLTLKNVLGTSTIKSQWSLLAGNRRPKIAQWIPKAAHFSLPLFPYEWRASHLSHEYMELFLITPLCFGRFWRVTFNNVQWHFFRSDLGNFPRPRSRRISTPLNSTATPSDVHLFHSQTLL
jgi:hypothetical protein